jgi:cytoskeletal protein CcmA (bactofilin family)
MIDNKTAGGAPVEFPTVIGADAVFKGELAFEKGVRIDGRLEGKVATKGFIAVSQGGHLQADVDAGSVIIEGEVKGNVTAADRIELRKSARLKGDVTASKLLVAEGAAFIGHCHIGPDAQKAPVAPPTNRIAEALPRK